MAVLPMITKFTGVKKLLLVAPIVALPYLVTVMPLKLGHVTLTRALKPGVQPINLILKKPCGSLLPVTGYGAGLAMKAVLAASMRQAGPPSKVVKLALAAPDGTPVPGTVLPVKTGPYRLALPSGVSFGALQTAVLPPLA